MSTSTLRTRVRSRSGIRDALGPIRGSRAYHEISRIRSSRDIQLRPELTDRPDLLHELDRDGIAIVPGYLSTSDAAQMLAASEETLARACSGDLPKNTFHGERGILLRISEADRLVPETGRFFGDPLVRSVFEAYLKPSVASHRHEYDYRYGLASVGLRQSDLFHFDNWRPICKAFLYLTDVGEENAPFVYLRGTHKPAAWRLRHERNYDRYGPDGPFGYLFPAEIRALRAVHGWQEAVCTGPAGTLILADYRGLHRGTPMRSGRRVLLNNTMDCMNPEMPPPA